MSIGFSNKIIGKLYEHFLWSGGGKSQMDSGVASKEEMKKWGTFKQFYCERAVADKVGRIQKIIFCLKVKRFDYILVHVLVVRSQWRGNIYQVDEIMPCCSSKQPPNPNGLLTTKVGFST